MKKTLFLLIPHLFLVLNAHASDLPIAPFLPAQEKTAPADAVITVQYPHENMAVSRGAKNVFIFGQVKLPAPVTLEINGSTVPVHTNGAFLAFLPVQSGPFEFALTATGEGKIYQAVRHITVPGADIKDFSAKAQFDKEEIFPQHPVEVLPTDTLDLYARGTPGGQVTASLSGVKDAKNILLRETATGIYRAQFTLPQDQKSKNIKVTYRMKEGPQNSSAKINAPQKIKVLPEKQKLRLAKITSPGIKLRKIPTPRENLYPFYRAYGQVAVTGRKNEQYRIRLNENETAWLEKEKMQLLSDRPENTAFNTVQELTQTVLPDKTRFVFAGTHAVPISVHEYSNRLELVLYYTGNFEENFSLDATSPLVEQVIWSQPAENTLLFQILFKQDATPWGHAYNFEDGNLILDLMHKPQLNPAPGKPLNGARILLDAGHSPRRQAPYDGAVGPTGYLEYEANLALAEELKPLLEKQGATVILTRKGSNRMSLQDRYQHALKEQAHLFISLHYNALPETSDPFARPRGYSVYYNYPHSFKLAEAIYKSFTRNVQLPDNGMIANDVLFIPRIAQMPSILVENAYLIVPEQEEMARNKESRQVFVQALYEGILDFYGVPRPALKPTTKKKETPKPNRKTGKKKSKTSGKTYIGPAQPTLISPRPTPVVSPTK